MAFTALATAITLLAVSCSKDDGETKDMEKPAILDGAVPVPTDCQVYHRGEEIPFRYTFTDNVALGSFNIEIHNNFDHHSHSTSAGDCPLDAKKAPVRPWVFNQDYTIAPGLRTYDAAVDIPIPTDIDPGDYHFMVRVTDASGWQQLKAISIKILE